MIRRYLPKDTEQLIHWYERYVSPFALIAGFLADNFIFLDRVDLWSGNALLFSYLVIAATAIVMMNMIETGRLRGIFVLRAAPYVPVVMQFAFGGLFSGYLSLYSRSAAFPLSWVFVCILAVLLIGNERFRRLYTLPSFQIGIYYGALFSFLIFFLPVIFRSIGHLMFLASGAASLALIALFLLLLQRLAPAAFRTRTTRIVTVVGSIYIVINVFYFLNLIPPLPLALKEAGVYHSVIRRNDVYTLTAEPLAWYQEYLPYNTSFTITPGDSAYVYTAVFAPSGLTTSIVHEWQRYDLVTGTWETVSELSFPVNGGRDGGYRGYSRKSAVTPGRWRVNVKTGYGQLIGRVGFAVQYGRTPALVAEER